MSAPIQILLAVYNGEKYLAPFLDSLVRQTETDFQLVVSDNRSTDGTLSILDSYRSRLRHPMTVLPAPPVTVSAHLNFARVTEVADAPYIMYADADDVWHDDKVQKTFEAMLAAEKQFGAATPVLVHSDLAVTDGRLNRLDGSYWHFHHLDPDRVGFNQLLMQNCVTGCTAMLNRPLLELGRPLPPESFVHDYWYALVAAAFGRIVKITEPLIEYRQHGGNVTGAKRWGLRYVLQRMGKLYSDEGASRMLVRNFEQARAFGDRYGERLSPASRADAAAFAQLGRQNAIARRISIVKHGFWKFGLTRNIGLLLAI